MVASPGPPRVEMNTMSNADSAAITVTVTQTPISLRRLGNVIERNSRTGPAPSICAAS